MNKLLLPAALISISIIGYTVATRLDAGALTMAVGVIFGVLAGVPTSLLMLASNRQSQPIDHWRERALIAEGKVQRIQTKMAAMIDQNIAKQIID